MRCGIVSIVMILLLSTGAFAAEFAPTLLKIEAAPVIQYSFDGSGVAIPVMVNGTTAGLIFSVFTKDFASEIGPRQNGYLGWHYVNKVDTCVYYSPLKSVNPGENIIEWDGLDQDGGLVMPGEYTYYIWAYDNQGAKQMMSQYMPSGWGFDYQTGIQEVDESGLPLANPIWYTRDSRWIIGCDPLDETLKITSNINLQEGWQARNEPLMDPNNFDYLYISVGNTEIRQGSIQKFKFVPGGDAELQTDWGESDGFATIFSTSGGGSPGVATDGNYLFTGDENHVSSVDPDSDFYIYDYDGYMVEEIDMTPWWSNADEFEQGGQMNGGPNSFYARDGRVFLNCHCNCLNQMVDPVRYLDSGEYDDFYVWSNGNGDYILDHNFEETAQLMWVCNDYNVGPYKYSISADANLFSAANAYDVGAVSFGLMAPDGTGLGYFAYAGETAGWKKGTLFLDGDTPFDGIYCDNEQTMGPHYDRNMDRYKPGIYFIGHDSVKGVITGSGSGPYLVLAAPSGGEKIMRGTQLTIKWYVYRVNHVKIDFSSDGGNNWTTIASDIDASLKSYAWDVPGTISDECYIRVSDADNSARYYTNKNPFAIIRPANTTEFYLTDVTNTGNNTTVLVDAANPPRIDGHSIDYDDNIGIFTPRGLCAGAAVWDGVNIAITVWGDDPMVDGTRGFLPGEPLTFKIWRAAEEKEYIVHPTYSTGNNNYYSDGFSVLSALENMAVEKELNFPSGWNYLSIPVRLSDYTVSNVLSSISEDVRIMKNGAGEVYWPEYDIDAIGQFDPADGYQLYIDDACSLVLNGYELFPPDISIELREGWNLIGCPVQNGTSIETAFASILDDIVIIKNGNGNVYWPEFEVDDIGGLENGSAYWVNVSKPVSFRYPSIAAKTIAANTEMPVPQHFGGLRDTGVNATLLVLRDGIHASGCTVDEGDEIGAFTDTGLCVGSARIARTGNIALALRGDDIMTETIDGLASGETFRLVFWDRETGTEYDATASFASPPEYAPNALLTAHEFAAGESGSLGNDGPDTFSLSQNSPNPFNPSTSIPFTLPKEGRITMTVYDITGRVVATLADGLFTAGAHEVVWDASGVASGVYLCRLQASGTVKTISMTLVK